MAKHNPHPAKDHKPADAGSTLARKWVGYRPEIQIVDCTIRDGGLMNDHKFDDATVTSVYHACVEAGIDFMEIGYKADRKVFAGGEHGPWKFSTEDDIRRIVGDDRGGLKVSVMADVGRTDYHHDILPKKDSVVDMVRVACYINQVPGALDMVKDAHDKGYRTAINLMSVSVVSEMELRTALDLFARSEADAAYIVDSFGYLFPEQVRWLHEVFRSHLRKDQVVGIHAHNNQQLAFANTIEAITLGSNSVDGSIAGLGRGAGNCPTELLVGFLRNPKYRLRPLLVCIQEAIEALRGQFHWGPDIPYMLAGLRNEHPRAAMAFNDETDRKDIVGFFDKLADQQ